MTMSKDPVVQFGVFYALLFPGVFGFGEYHFAEASCKRWRIILLYLFICPIVSVHEIWSVVSRNIKISNSNSILL